MIAEGSERNKNACLQRRRKAKQIRRKKKRICMEEKIKFIGGHLQKKEILLLGSKETNNAGKNKGVL